MSEPEGASSGSAEGGCLCGRVRYRVALPPIDAGYCHCSLCRRSAGAPVTVWGTFRREALSLTGDPREYRSSPQGLRRFCPDCGTQLLFLGDRTPVLVDVNLATLDDPAAVPPQYHVWTAARIPWFETADRLPRHQGAGPDGAGD